MSEENKSLRTHVPRALHPIYNTPEPNAAIPLYRGKLKLGEDPPAVEVGGCIDLTWQPRYATSFDLPDIDVPFSTPFEGPNKIAAQHFQPLFEQAAKVNGLPYGMTANADPTHQEIHQTPTGFKIQAASGILADIDLPPAAGLSEIIFHLPNFVDYTGELIAYPPNRLQRGRLRIEAGGWSVVIDEIVGVLEKVRKTGGYAFTHVGQLERVGGALFTSDEAAPILEALMYLFWFVKGRCTSPLLSVGFTADGQRVWEDWRPMRQARWKDNLSWFPELYPQALGTLFSAVLKIVKEGIWYEPFKLAISWYIQAIDAPSLESGIVTAQIGLELLAWVEIVEKHQVVSKEGFDKLSTTDKLRLFLLSARIPASLPAELTALTTLAASKSNGKQVWRDGPEALVELRNSITHAKRREAAYGAPVEARREAQTLALWYMELLILHILGYQGVYTCRLPERPILAGQHEPVPWAAGTQFP